MTPNPVPRSLIRRVAASVSFYTLALVAAGSVRLLAVLFIVRVISPTAYGTYATLWVVMWFIQAGGDLGLGTAGVRFAPECRTASERRSLFATVISARALVGSVLTAIVIVAHEPLARWTTGSSENGRALVWLALSRPFAMVLEALSDELRARSEMGKVSWLVLLSGVLIQGLSVVFVIGAGLELMGLVWARALGETLACGAAAVLCFRWVRGRPRLSDLRHLLAFGWPIGAMILLGVVRGLDRPLIRSLTSLGHVATYELAARLVGPIGLFNIALAKVFEPVVYGHSQSPETPAHVDLFLRAYVALFATVAMSLSLLGPEGITLLVPTAYHEAIRVLPALAFATTCEGLMHVAGIGADLAKRTRVWAGAALLTPAIGFPLIMILVPHVGISGVALAWVVANTVTAVFVYWIAWKVSGFVLPVGRALGILVVGALLGTKAAWAPWPLGIRLVLLVGFGVTTCRVLGLRYQSLKDLLRGLDAKSSFTRENAR